MRLKPALLLTFCLLTWPAVVVAHLGESREQLVARYGPAEELKPEDVGGLHGVLAFQKDGFYIHAEVYQGRCEYIMFAKDGSSPISQGEIQTLLKASGGKRAWEGAAPDKSGVSKMRTTDGEIEASLSPERDILMIRTREATRRHQAITKTAG